MSTKSDSAISALKLALDRALRDLDAEDQREVLDALEEELSERQELLDFSDESDNDDDGDDDFDDDDEF